MKDPEYKMKTFNRYLYVFLTLMLMVMGQSYASSEILLAKNKTAQYVIVLPSKATVARQFAASELAGYLEQISGAVFSVTSSPKISEKKILLRTDLKMEKEDYSISTSHQNDVVLTGGSDRAVLYAVYDFLSRLGCRWLAPGFAFYNGTNEYIPHQAVLYYNASRNVSEHPAFAYRKLDVEEGQSHTVENLKQLIEWMPKLRFNILMIPLDYQGSGRVQWDKWRKELTPELKKRDLMIEVGGHGYQNFINAGMENGNLFKQHPDWFGKDKSCNPARDDYFVFNTSNADAVSYFINNILGYIRQHPEIDIFDLWPPDGAHWADCPEWQALGSPEDRQAHLLNQVDSAVKASHPDLKLEIIAYAKALLPPENVQISKNVLVDFCPIDQNFETQIYDTVSTANVNYANAIRAWRKKFGGDISLYSYFRKYAWKSLPNIIPHYMQRDMKWYASVPLQGISTYAEPGDWYTYELNHYVLGQLAWNPDVNADSLIRLFCETRYGAASLLAEKAYAILEHTVRIYGSIRNSSLKSKEDISRAISAVEDEMNTIRKAEATSGEAVSANFSRLLLMFQYALIDLKIREALSAKASPEVIRNKIGELLSFFQKNRNEGTLVLTGREDTESLIRYYNR